MRPAYIQRFVRFTVALLLLLLATLLLQPGLSGLRAVMATTSATVGRYVLYAVPVALLFGVPAGLRPGSLLDRLLQLPVLLLAGMPAVAVGLALLQVDGHPVWLTELGATLVAAPWLARALRMGLAASHGKGARRAMLSCLGRMLQQYGNLAVCVLPLDAVLGAGPAALADSSSAGSFMLGLALPALISHLLGDLLVTAAEGPEPMEPAARPSLWWLGLGLILALGLAGLPATGGGRSLLGAPLGIAAGLLLGLAAGGLGRWGQLVAPDLETPSLLAPFAAGLWLVFWLKPAWWVVGAGVGLAMAPWIAPGVRRWVSAPAAQRGPLGRAVAGAVIMLLARAIYVEMLLSWVSLSPAPPLGRALVGALGVAGLNLLGADLAAEK